MYILVCGLIQCSDVDIWLTMLLVMNWSRGNQENYLTITLPGLVSQESLDSEPGYFLRAGTLQTEQTLRLSLLNWMFMIIARVTGLTYFHTQHIRLLLLCGAPSLLRLFSVSVARRDCMKQIYTAKSISISCQIHLLLILMKSDHLGAQVELRNTIFVVVINSKIK